MINIILLIIKLLLYILLALKFWTGDENKTETLWYGIAMIMIWLLI